ncbi:MAG: helix-turn-helix domain-containing protein [Alicyclobacillus sp.]|nr:helix-turn-helix domain-containing protein [Alicyclobacillus sp.]
MSGKRAKLRRLRKLLGISGEAMATAAGMTRQAYSQLESGNMAARPERMAPMNRLLRAERQKRIEQLRREIELLESFDIDETLYLKDAEEIVADAAREPEAMEHE